MSPLVFRTLRAVFIIEVEVSKLISLQNSLYLSVWAVLNIYSKASKIF